MQFLREIRTFSGKKAFFSCNFQLQSEARRRLLVRSCLGAPPATAHGGHWDVAATGDGLPWPKFHGNFGDNSWETPGIEPWSHGAHGWSTWWTFGQRGAGKCDGLELHEAVLLWALKLWGHQTEMVAVAKKCALTGLVLHWHFHLAPNDDQPSPCWIFSCAQWGDSHTILPIRMTKCKLLVGLVDSIWWVSCSTNVPQCLGLFAIECPALPSCRQPNSWALPSGTSWARTARAAHETLLSFRCPC